MKRKILYFGLDPSRFPVQEGLWHYPLIETLPVNTHLVDEFVKQGVSADLCVVTSQQTVRYLFESVKRCQLEEIYKNLSWISIGEATTESLKNKGVEKIVTACNETAEGVIEVLKNHSPERLRILYPHSQISRPLLGKFLQSFNVLDMALYTTRSSRHSMDINGFTDLVFTSASTVVAFHALYPKKHLNNFVIWLKGPLVEKKLYELFPNLQAAILRYDLVKAY